MIDLSWKDFLLPRWDSLLGASVTTFKFLIGAANFLANYSYKIA